MRRVMRSCACEHVRTSSAHVTHLARGYRARGRIVRPPVSDRRAPRALTLHEYGVRSTEYVVYGDWGPVRQQGGGEPLLLNGYIDLATHA